MYENYVNTIYWLAELYDPIFKLTDDEWDDFADFLLVDADYLKKCVYSEKRIRDIDYMEFNYASLFNLFFKTFICVDNIKKISEIEDQTDNDSISRIYSLFMDTITLISSLNAELATFMCMKEKRFSTNFAVQDWKGKDYPNEIWFLTYYMDDEPFSLSKETLQISIKSIKYDLETRLNTVYYTGVLLMIDNAPFFKDDIKYISNEMYLYLISLLKNCRLIGMKLNLSAPHMDIENRGRIDNTTQILMIYGYDNHDAYCLRFDLPHKGIQFIHYNNRSPGNGNNEVKSCIFNRDEYNDIISKYTEFPNICEWFINYGELFALKERVNCNFNNTEEENLFDTLESNHEHVRFSEIKYNEKSILEFIELLSFFYRSQRETIQSDEYAIKCFNYDRIMLLSRLLTNSVVHCELTGNDYKIDEQINTIVKTAIRYGIIEQYDEPYSIEDVKIVIEYTEERISPILR